MKTGERAVALLVLGIVLAVIVRANLRENAPSRLFYERMGGRHLAGRDEDATAVDAPGDRRFAPFDARQWCCSSHVDVE